MIPTAPYEAFKSVELHNVVIFVSEICIHPSFRLLD